MDSFFSCYLLSSCIANCQGGVYFYLPFESVFPVICRKTLYLLVFLFSSLPDAFFTAFFPCFRCICRTAFLQRLRSGFENAGLAANSVFVQMLRQVRRTNRLSGSRTSASALQTAKLLWSFDTVPRQDISRKLLESNTIMLRILKNTLSGTSYYLHFRSVPTSANVPGPFQSSSTMYLQIPCLP